LTLGTNLIGSKEKHHQGTNEEIAYRFFAIACNDKIKNAMEAIINEEKVLLPFIALQEKTEQVFLFQCFTCLQTLQLK
jgi:hypothetical protein